MTPRGSTVPAAAVALGEAMGERHYRIANVAELTGVPEPTLRAWERRYGVPTPERTASRYRLYGDDDVEQVREMRRLCESGLAASEAARTVLERKVVPSGPRVSVDDPWQALVDAMLDTVNRFDDRGLDEHLRRATFLGSAVTIFDRVFTPFLVAVGERWHRGQLSVAQEHLVTQKVAVVLRDLVRLSPGSRASSSAIFASFADDEHEIGLLGFALRAAELEIRPIFLGARTPPSAVRSAVQAVAPRLVALSITLTPPPARARELLDDYAAACGSTPWVVGGSAARSIASLVTERGGLVAPSDPNELSALARRLLAASGVKPPKGSRR